MINRQAIKSGLDKAYRNNEAIKQLSAINTEQENQTRYIIFSDQHRGARNGADDFKRSEQAYNAALAYYNAMEYHLIALGDVEELWEETPETVLEAYDRTLSLEHDFHKNGRYHRVFGNHDEIWQDPANVKKYLQPHFGERELKVHEGFKIPVAKNGRDIGELFLVHGHQGTADSDKYAWFSKLFVRYVWQPFQRLTKYRLNTPAQDWELRQGYNEAMYEWAKNQREKVVLITGHTHKPVFESQTKEQQLLAAQQAIMHDKTLPDAEKRQKRAELAVQIERFRTVESADAEVIADMLPCYFNTGCCSFADGDVTGLEIADNQIKLIRWSGDNLNLKPEILAAASLEMVFDKIRADRQTKAQPQTQPGVAQPGGLFPQPALATG